MTERNTQEITDNENTDKQYLLDLLVDGELADDQRRELLAWCEREPDGWRRCALAFLEAQDWSQVFGRLAAPVRQHSSPLAPREESVVRPAFGRPRQWRTILAMAASVALAFTLGVWVRDAGKVQRIAPDGATSIQLVENKSSPQLSPIRPEQGPRHAGAVAGGSSQAVGEIQLPLAAADGWPSDGRLSDGRPTDDWLTVEPAAMPDNVRRALEHMGHRVEQRRQLVPYRLRDGRRVVVPVDQVEVQPVGNRNYQ
ncbi:MAG TPA: hypothetical protein VF278_23555 [Pirellulales bacterium]